MINILTQRILKHGFRCFLGLTAQAGRRSKLDQFYFAYGANLSTNRLANNNIQSINEGTYQALGYKLRFNVPCEYSAKGFASIEPEPHSCTWGLLYRVGKLDLKMLDILEWVLFKFYKREKVLVQSADGESNVEAWAFVAQFPTDGLVPSSSYKNFIIKSARELNFPEAYIEYLAGVPSMNKFELDPGFRLSNPGKKRFFIHRFRRLYLFHDQIREKLSRLIP